MADRKRKRLIFSAFTENKHGAYWGGLWRYDWGWTLDANDIDDWVAYVKLLEKGKFDFLFLADTLGIYDTHGGNGNAAMRHGVSIPENDPFILSSALATATKNLGFIFSHAPVQSPPYDFARKMSTIDHLSKGRVGWNIVTGFTHSGARNFGADRLPAHADRYRAADEYVDILYRLWEGSWEEDAFVRDTARGVFIEPDKVHPIDFEGVFYKVAGPHQSSPSPQRTPFLCQAGASDVGRAFAARHAEAIFMPTPSKGATRTHVHELRELAKGYGRQPDDIICLMGAWFVIGGTEEEARRKHADIVEKSDAEAFLVDSSGKSGVDFSKIDLDTDLREISADGIQGVLRAFLKDNPARKYTFRDYAKYKLNRVFIGTPEQIADQLEDWQATTGLDGFQVFGMPSTSAISDFVEGLRPTLLKRGLMQEDYAQGTLREKIFGLDRYLPASHPAKKHNRALQATMQRAVGQSG
ncbi:MAG: NtaA/DmoA family FMN-dependent monooxygenase [Pseudorhodoplanes sp.]